MWVVKLGGSLLGAQELRHWLDRLVKCSDGKIVIVPGGGIFADAVREAQQRSGIDDISAHHLALMAMDQFGLLLAGMHPGLVTASSELEIAERGWQHRCIVWLPSRMVMADDSIPKNWQVTSDSLSAWLADKLGAEQLILVKSASLAAYHPVTPISRLMADALLDHAFEDAICDKNFPVWLLNKADYECFATSLNLQLLTQKAVRVVAIN